MAVAPGSIAVSESVGKLLDTAIVSTSEGSVHREGVFIGDAETGGNRATVGANGLYVEVRATVAAPNQATGQVTTSTAAATLVIARPTRKSVLVRNLDTAITIYIGPATVTAANGMPLRPGESVPIDTTALIQVIAASGTPVVAFYDVWY